MICLRACALLLRSSAALDDSGTSGSFRRSRSILRPSRSIRARLPSLLGLASSFSFRFCLAEDPIVRERERRGLGDATVSASGISQAQRPSLA